MDGEVPRIPWRSHVPIRPPRAHRELDRASLADDDEAGLDEPVRQRRGHRRDARFPHLRAAGRDPAPQIDEVLERDRHTVESPDRPPRSPGAIGRRGRGTCIVRVHLDEGAEPGLEPFDSREQRLHETLRGQLTRRQRIRGGVSRSKVRKPFTVAHPLSMCLD